MRPATALEVVSRRLSLEDPEGEVERADEHEEQREEHREREEPRVVLGRKHPELWREHQEHADPREHDGEHRESGGLRTPPGDVVSELCGLRMETVALLRPPPPPSDCLLPSCARDSKRAHAKWGKAEA